VELRSDAVTIGAAKAFQLSKSVQKSLALAQKPAMEPGRAGTSRKSPQLTNLAHGLHVHTRSQPGGLALAQALV
jgi:hypothetical protein